jgi:glutathione S-transferase
MRARLALASSGMAVEHREILLRDKPEALLAASPKGTVPVIVLSGTVIDESLDVMFWALGTNDPESWLDYPKPGDALIEDCDGPFKQNLDRYKYASRDPQIDPAQERQKAAEFIWKLNAQLGTNNWLFGDEPMLPDMAILTFVRQFAHVDLGWFETQDWGNVNRWLAEFKSSERFKSIMKKHPVWVPDAIVAAV